MQILGKVVATVCVVSGALAETRIQEFETAGLERIEFRNAVGNIQVNVVEGLKASVKAESENFGERCQAIIERKDKVLLARVERFSLRDSDQCIVHLTASVPKKIHVDITSGSGDLNIRNTEGKILFSLGSGNVSIQSSVASLEGKTGSGNIEVEGLKGDAVVRSGSGYVKLSFAEVPSSGIANVMTGSGLAQLTLPKGAKIKTNLKSGSGKVHNDFREEAKAKYQVSVKSGSGDVMVTSRE